MFKNKNILVTGAAGMIGRYIVNELKKENCKITATDIYKPNNYLKDVEFIEADLRYFDICQKLCKKKDIIMHLAGIKGSPKVCLEQPAKFMVPMFQFNTTSNKTNNYKFLIR